MPVNLIKRLTASGQQPIAPITPSVQPALTGSLFVPSGLRSYNGADYDFSANGLYTLFSIYGPSSFNAGNCISYSGDVVELMRAISYLVQYGTRDEGLTASQAQNQMRMRKVGMRCDYVNDIVVAPLCSQVGVPHRTVHWLTAQTPNSFDDGHVACEVKIGGVWKYFDVPTKACVESAGVIQSLGEIADAGLANLSTVEICPSDSYPETWSGTVFPSAVYFAQNLANAEMRNEWRQRIYQIPGIDHSDGLTYFFMPTGTSSRQTWVESLSSKYRVVSRSTWMSMFY